MRNETLYGYVVHQRHFKEKSRIVHFFCAEYGRMDGVLRSSSPLLPFTPMQLLANGQRDLKTFTQPESLYPQQQLVGQALLAGLYINELIYRLLPKEAPFLLSFAQYGLLVRTLGETVTCTTTQLSQYMRFFEHTLISELGYGIAYTQDTSAHPILAHADYRYHVQRGFIAEIATAKNNAAPDPTHSTSALISTTCLAGEDILNAQAWLNTFDYTSPTENDLFVPRINPLLKYLHRHTLEHMLGGKRLMSQQLWKHTP